LSGSYGVYIDTSTSPLGHINPQIFFNSGFAIDSNTLDGVLATNSSIGDLFCRGSWVSSNGGSGIQVQPTQSASAIVHIAGCNFENNVSHGAAALGATWNFVGNYGHNNTGSMLYVGNNASVFAQGNVSKANGRYGIEDGTAGNQVTDGGNKCFANTLGCTLSASGFAPAQMSSALQVNQSATIGWQFDTSQVAYAVNASTTIALAVNASGVIEACESRNGSCASFVVGGGGTTLLGQSVASIWVVSATPATNEIGLSFNGGTVGYEIKTGSAAGWNSKNVYIKANRVRPAG
jgi:hypothetical protein